MKKIFLCMFPQKSNLSFKKCGACFLRWKKYMCILGSREEGTLQSLALNAAIFYSKSCRNATNGLLGISNDIHSGILKYSCSWFYDINRRTYAKNFWEIKTQLWPWPAGTKLMKFEGFQKYKIHSSILKGIRIIACKSWYKSTLLEFIPRTQGRLRIF